MRIRGIETRCRPPLAAVVFAALWVPVSASAQSDAAGLARRIAAIVSIAADEYALGVTDGRVISAVEVDEARLFLDEALAAAAELPEPARSAAMPQVRALVEIVASLGPPADVRAGLAVLRTRLAIAIGVPLDPMPRSPPSLARGAQLYEANCASCHGGRGAGDGQLATKMDPRPSNLADRSALRGSSPLDFYRKVTFGIAGTGMLAFEEGLTLEERWAVALYTSGLRYADQDRGVGARWFAEECDSCRLWISDFQETAGLTDDSLAGLVAALASVPPLEALAFARTAASADLLGGDRRLAAQRVARRVTLGVEEAVALYLAGDRRAAVRRAVGAYLQFEQVESVVAARNAGVARGVELAFAELRSALGAGDADRVVATRGQVDVSVQRAVEVMSAASSPALLFGQSLLIILREGLEAMLIVAALAAFVVKAGARSRLREITGGVLVALAASVITAVALVSIWRLSAAHREVLEGANMLLASVVLFVVASWLVSKIESEKWKKYVQQQMSIALSGGSAFALAGVSFLVVYREGFETVLFYGALFGTAEDASGTAGIVLGLGLGLVLLAGLYVGIQRYGIRIPLRPFFAVTGILLTVLSVSFAGQGVAELQAAGWIPSTPINLPALPALGVFPTVQTWVAQLLLAAAFAGTLGWIFLVSPRFAASALPRQRR